MVFKYTDSLSSVIYIHDFRADHLVLDNQLVFFPWGRLFLLPSAFLSCLQFFVWGWWGLVSFPVLVLACPLVASLFRSWLGSHVGETSWLLFLTFLGDTIGQQTLCPSGAESLSAPLFLSAPWALGAGIVLQMYPLHWDLCNGLCCQENLLKSVATTLFCGSND